MQSLALHLNSGQTFLLARGKTSEVYNLQTPLLAFTLLCRIAIQHNRQKTELFVVVGKVCTKFWLELQPEIVVKLGGGIQLHLVLNVLFGQCYLT
jgi:hypothetical protein